MSQLAAALLAFLADSSLFEQAATFSSNNMFVALGATTELATGKYSKP
jgi:hypothetical protein